MLEDTLAVVVTDQLQRRPLVLVVLFQRLRAVADGVRLAAFLATLGGVLTKPRRHDKQKPVVRTGNIDDVKETGVHCSVILKQYMYVPQL